ncbi:MAG: hypothetical protein ACYC2G_06520 [Gemmatimonadaceae bacterium]
MTSERLEKGVAAGLTAAAAVMGALLALAWRAGAPLEPLMTTGRAMLDGGTPVMALVVGVVSRLADGVLWGLLLAAIAGGLRRWPGQLVAAIVVSGAAAVVHATLLPTLRLGYGLGIFPLHGAPLYFLYLLFAAALAVGMRIAGSDDPEGWPA